MTYKVYGAGFYYVFYPASSQIENFILGRFALNLDTDSQAGDRDKVFDGMNQGQKIPKMGKE